MSLLINQKKSLFIYLPFDLIMLITHDPIDLIYIYDRQNTHILIRLIVNLTIIRTRL